MKLLLAVITAVAFLWVALIVTIIAVIIEHIVALGVAAGTCAAVLPVRSARRPTALAARPR